MLLIASVFTRKVRVFKIVNIRFGLLLSDFMHFPNSPNNSTFADGAV
jgi:hypothetical protein